MELQIRKMFRKAASSGITLTSNQYPIFATENDTVDPWSFLRNSTIAPCWNTSCGIRSSSTTVANELHMTDEHDLFPLYTAISEPHVEQEILETCQWLVACGTNLRRGRMELFESGVSQGLRSGGLVVGTVRGVAFVVDDFISIRVFLLLLF